MNPDTADRDLYEYCINALSEIMSHADAPVSVHREAVDKRRRLQSGDLATCDIIGWALRRPQTDYWRRRLLLIDIDKADADNEEVKARAKEKELAKHVALHPEDAGRTVEDFKWMVMLWEPSEDEQDHGGGEFEDTEDADDPSETLH